MGRFLLLLGKLMSRSHCCCRCIRIENIFNYPKDGDLGLDPLDHSLLRQVLVVFRGAEHKQVWRHKRRTTQGNSYCRE